MKICFLTGDIFRLGGVQRVLSVIASELSKYHEVNILCTYENIKIDRSIYNLDERVDIIETKGLNNKSFINKILKGANKITGLFNNKHLYKILVNAYYPHKMQSKLIQYLKNNDYDVVIGVEGYYAILLGVISNELKMKTIGWQHNSYDAYLKNPYRYYWNRDVLFDKYISKLDDYIVLNEYDSEMYMKEKGIKSSVIYNPRSFKSNIKSKGDKNIFLAAGRFNYQKGFDLLIESFNIFSKKNIDWKLVIVGEGKEKGKLLKMIKDFGLEDRVKIDNFTNNISEYFLKSSVLLLSSRWEGMPMIALESLEMGVPIIAYDITAVKPLIDNMAEGIIVDKFDVNKFADAMLKISESYELRQKMSRNAITKSKAFDIFTIVDKWNKIL